MSEEKKNEMELTKGQKDAAEIMAFLAGIGGGGLVGGILIGMVKAMKFGKIMTLLTSMGAFGISWVIDREVDNEVEYRLKEIFKGTNKLKNTFRIAKEKAKKEPVQAEGQVS